MILIPQPKSMKIGHGLFSINNGTIIDIPLNSGGLFIGNSLKDFLLEKLGLRVKLDKSKGDSAIKFFIDKSLSGEESYNIKIDTSSVSITAASNNGLFYGLQTLKQVIRNNGRHLKELDIHDEPLFSERGYYYDITRGKVPTLDMLKELADLAASYKLNQIQLYVEHTFAFKGHSEIWTVTDPLTAEEIMEFDEYCSERHIELVPSFSTFGHLYEALRSESFSDMSELDNPGEKSFSWVDRMCHHTLDVSNDKSIEFIKDLLNQVMPLFKSNKFNICADETFDLGKGKNKERAEKEGKSQLYVEFLNKIVNHVKAYGKEVLFWGDIIIEYPEKINDLPKDLVCLNWYYWEHYPEEKVKIIRDNGFEQVLCTGVNGWNKWMNDHEMAYKNISMMTEYGKKYSVRGMLNTDWGDFGHMNLFSNSKPGLIMGAYFSWSSETIGYEEISDRIDFLEYGLNQDEKSVSLMSLLDRISKNHLMEIEPVVYWIHEHDIKALGELDIDEDRLNEINKELIEIEGLLLDLLCKVDVNNRGDIEEYIVSGKAVRLFNQLYLVMKQNLLKEEVTLDLPDAGALAEELEYMLSDFKVVWRKRNKESELFRIVDFIRTVCGELRKF